MYLIAGLGNPTPRYEGTRHNTGFAALDCLAEKTGISLNQKSHKAIWGSGTIDGKKVILAKPQTFMNLSGESVGALVSYYKIELERILVLVDDVTLPPGQLRVRRKGSAGGHNGMKSVIAALGTDEFARIKIGVGEKPKEFDLADYVLSRFPLEEQDLMENAVKDAAKAALIWLEEGTDVAMNQFNAKKESKVPKAAVEKSSVDQETTAEKSSVDQETIAEKSSVDQETTAEKSSVDQETRERE